MRRLPFLAVSGLLSGLLSLSLGACGTGSPDTTNPTQPAGGAPPAPTQPTAIIPAPATRVPNQPRPAPPAVPTAAPALPTAAPAPGEPQRIAFAPGAETGSVDGAVARGDRQRYVLWARAGQVMEVHLSAREQNAAFSVFAPDGRVLAGTEEGADATDWMGPLPADGDYQISVGGTRGNASYRLSVGIFTPQPAAPPIRGTDWSAVIAADPALEVTQVEGKPYVNVRGAQPGVGGHPLLDTSIVYVDMDGDGVEEAAITLNSGGTAGNIGFLVYRQASPAPRLTAWHGGYKLGLETEGGRLVVRQALYAGWEPNCCPSGFSRDTYELRNGQLILVAHRDEGFPEMQAATVEHFYELLNQKDLAGAYALLSGAEQAANPFDTWAQGFAGTIDVQAVVTPDPATPNVVHVALAATDRTGDGGQVTRRFAGTWGLVWAESRGWLLANPRIQELG
jgi:hypothetical protein